MAKVEHIKAAAKDYPEDGIKKGEPYYKWALFRGPVRRSKTPPRQSQLTQSEFYSTLYAIQEDMGDLEPKTLAELKADIEGIKERIETLRDDTQEKLDNMPEGLQQGDTGQMLSERVDAMENWLSEIDNLDIPEEGEEGEEDEKDKPNLDDLLEELKSTDPGV